MNMNMNKNKNMNMNKKKDMKNYTVHKIAKKIYNVTKDDVSDYMIYMGGDKPKCNCPHFRYREPDSCKHIDFVLNASVAAIIKTKTEDRNNRIEKFNANLAKRKKQVANLIYMIEEDEKVYKNLVK